MVEDAEPTPSSNQRATTGVARYVFTCMRCLSGENGQGGARTAAHWLCSLSRWRPAGLPY